MDRKEPFNDALQGKEEARKQQITEWERECARDVEMREKQQHLRRCEDMEKARRQVLREHNRLDLWPDYAWRKALTSAQREERAPCCGRAEFEGAECHQERIQTQDFRA